MLGITREVCLDICFKLLIQPLELQSLIDGEGLSSCVGAGGLDDQSRAKRLGGGTYRSERL